MVVVLSGERIKEARLTPAATIEEPLSWFSPFGIKFERGEDDLDAYCFAGLEGPGGLAFGLLHYNAEPDGQTTLLLPEAVASGDHLVQVIATLSKHFDIPLSRIHLRQ